MTDTYIAVPKEELVRLGMEYLRLTVETALDRVLEAGRQGRNGDTPSSAPSTGR